MLHGTVKEIKEWLKLYIVMAQCNFLYVQVRL